MARRCEIYGEKVHLLDIMYLMPNKQEETASKFEKSKNYTRRWDNKEN